MTFPTPANHGPSCRHCHGTGWTDAPPITETIEGRPHPYTALRPCSNDWWNDEPALPDEPLPADHPRARAVFAAEYAAGIAERDATHPPTGVPDAEAESELF
jgi:hypothetical protein